MRSVQSRRRGFINLKRITLGDYIVLASSLLMVISLFLKWFISHIPGLSSQWAFTYSEIAAVVVILFFLATLFLVLYPAVANELNLPPLPFATPVPYLFMGFLLLVIFDFQLGKYSCIECQGSSAGFGVWLALIASVFYIFGAIVRWSSRSTRR